MGYKQLYADGDQQSSEVVRYVWGQICVHSVKEQAFHVNNKMGKCTIKPRREFQGTN